MVDQPYVLQKLSICNWHSHSRYTQVNSHVEDFANTTAIASQTHILSPLQSSYSGLMVEPSTFPVRYSVMSAHDSPFLSCKREATHGPHNKQGTKSMVDLKNISLQNILSRVPAC